MKSPHLLLASLLVLSLGTASVQAQAPTPFNTQTPNENPDKKKCCKCVTWSVGGDFSGDSGESLVLQNDKEGNFWFAVEINFPDNDDECEDSYDYLLTAKPLKGGDPIYKTGSISKGTDVIRYFKIDSELARFGEKWQVSFSCEKGSDSTDHPFNPEKFVTPNECDKPVEFQLGECASCPCNTNGAPTMTNYPFAISIPTTQSNGGNTNGKLTYHTSDFSNAGLSSLSASYSPGIQVVRDGEEIMTSLNTGVNTIQLSPASSTILAQDPNAFTVTHKDPSGNQFRTTTVSMVEEGGVQRLRMDSTFGDATIRHERTNPQPNVFVMEKGSVVSGVFHALSRESMTTTEPSAMERVRRIVLQERANSASSWTTTSDSVTHLARLYGGWKIVKTVDDPDGLALTSTWSFYQPGDVTGPNGSTEGLGRVKQHVGYDGSQSFYTYGFNKQTVTTPYGENPAGKVETTEWDPGTRTQTFTTTILGQIISKKTIAHTATTTTNTTHTSSGSTLTTVTHYKPSNVDFGGRPVRVIRPDGTITTYDYTRESGGGVTTITEEGSTTDSVTVAKGTRTTTRTNSRGTTILSKTEAIGYGTGSAVSSFMVATSVDDLGRVLSTAYFPSNIELMNEYYEATGAAWNTTTTYSCCGVASETDMYGVKTFYAYDGLQRQIKSNRLGVTTETVRSGLTSETHRYSETVSASLSPASNASAATLVGKSVTNLAVTVQESWSPDTTSSTPGALVKSTTTTTYQPSAGLSTREITTTPDNFSQTTDSFLDGRTAATYGALSPAMAYSYTVNSTGEVTSQSYVDGSNFRETTTTQSDWAGRTLSTTLMDGAVTSMHYNSKGQLVRTVDADQTVTLYAYNEEGERTTSAIDLDPSATYNDEADNIQYGVDAVTFSETEPAMRGSTPVWRTISKVWYTHNSVVLNPVVGLSDRTPDGLQSWSWQIGQGPTPTHQDATFSTSLTVLEQDEDGIGTSNWTTTQISPDGTKQVQNYTGGLLASTSSLKIDNSVLHMTSYSYDSLNRPVTQTDSRTGSTVTSYLTTTSDVVASITDPGNRTTAFTYDVRGRRTVVNAPDSLDAENNTLANVTTTSYNPDSTVAETNGDQTYRTTHTYDYAQRQVTMTTYGSTTATTSWIYSKNRGFLVEKNYHGETGNGLTNLDYTYSAAGRLLTRTWERGITTTYGYDSGGRLKSTNYSDDTPDVEVNYDALGRQTAQSNGIAATTYAYDPATLALDTETIAYDLDPNTAGPEFTRVIDRSRDNLNRDTGWKVGTIAQYNAGWVDGNGDPDRENSTIYSYGVTDGRLQTVFGASNSSSQYSYLPNSNLLHTVTGPVHTVTNTWEATRDVLASKGNSKLDNTVISSYTYIVNHLGQRTEVNKAGTAFASARSIDWGYNSKGELVKADSSITGFDRAYQYDGIGNRLKSANSLTLPTSNNYTPNALNQYTAVDALSPGYDDDGNATAYPLPANLSANSTLTWDAENRLIAASVNSVTTTYLYDSQSRRIAQTTGSATTLYVYDGWNPIAEYSGATLSKTYTWGMDLSGSMQGAGGVGGLLAVIDTTGSYFPTYDGNGNVSEYMDSTGAIAAHYEYDPFGRETVAEGPKSNDFAHRFSTKPVDSTTGLLYYGYRYYDPLTGRWPSRDPIGERGGMNLYGFVGNDSSNRLDSFGLWYADGTSKPDGVHGIQLDGKGTLETAMGSGFNKWDEIHEKFHIAQISGGLDPRPGYEGAKPLAATANWNAIPYKQLFKCCHIDDNGKPDKSRLGWCYYVNSGSEKEPDFQRVGPVRYKNGDDLWSRGTALWPGTSHEGADSEIPAYEWSLTVEKNTNKLRKIRELLAEHKRRKAAPNVTYVAWTSLIDAHRKEKERFRTLNLPFEWAWKDTKKVYADLLALP